MRVAFVQSAPSLSRRNYSDIVNQVKSHIGRADLILFPELAMNGYMLQDKLYEDAYTLEELEELKELSWGIDIALGIALKDKKVFRNAALYYSKGELIYQHNKVELPNYGMFEEARYFSAGDSFRSFHTSHAKIALLVCEDLWSAKLHYQLHQEDPDVIIVLAASPARGFEDDKLLIEDQWYSLLKSAALQCDAKVLFINRVGFEDGLGFWGGSCVISEDARVVHKMAKFDERIEIFEIEGLR